MPDIPILNEFPDFAINAASTIIPSSIVTGAPTIVDANSLGILVTGAGIGQVKRFIAAAAVRDAANPKTKIGPSWIDNDPNILAEPLIANNEITPIITPDYLLGDKTKFLGTNVFDTFSIGPGQFFDNKFDESGKFDAADEPTKLPVLRFNAAILSVTVDRTIIQTTPVGSNIGTIKELISLGEYNIKVTGHIINEDNPLEYPTDAIQLLREYLNAPIAIPVDSYFLNTVFGITKVVIESLNLSQVEGFSGMVTYDMSMVSDTQIGFQLGSQLNNTPIKNPNN